MLLFIDAKIIPAITAPIKAFSNGANGLKGSL
jgi:hypothetical protein